MVILVEVTGTTLCVVRAGNMLVQVLVLFLSGFRERTVRVKHTGVLTRELIVVATFFSSIDIQREQRLASIALFSHRSLGPL